MRAKYPSGIPKIFRGVPKIFRKITHVFDYNGEDSGKIA
jgi:hypothetical protein